MAEWGSEATMAQWGSEAPTAQWGSEATAVRRSVARRARGAARATEAARLEVRDAVERVHPERHDALAHVPEVGEERAVERVLAHASMAGSFSI